MTYSKTTIEKMVKRMSETGFTGIPELSKEKGIPSQTLYRWRQCDKKTVIFRKKFRREI